MWDYSFMTPCVLVMLTLFAFYLSRMRLRTRLNVIFLDLLAIEALVIMLDIVSTKMDEHYQQFGLESLYVVNTLFFVAYLVRIFWFCRFTWALLNLNPKEHRVLAVLKYAPVVVGIAVCATSFATGAVFTIAGDGYHSGPLYVMLALVYLYYIVYSVCLLSSAHQRMRPRDYACGLAFNVLLLLGTAMRLAFPKVLVMDTFCTTAILVIYLAFANPDLYLTDNGLAFNSRGFLLLMDEAERQRSYSVMGIALRNYESQRSVASGSAMDEAIELICAYLAESFPGTSPFYLRSGRFVLMGDDKTDWGVVRAKLLDRFSKPWSTSGASLSLGVSLVYADSNASAEPASQIANNLVLALDNARQQVGGSATESAASPLSMNAVDEQVEVTRRLEHALKNERVEAYLQPIVSAATYELVGAEALARIVDDGQVLSPGQFIPIAEKGGYINELGCQVMKKVCAFISTHDVSSTGLQWININVSPLQCTESDLSTRFHQVLEQYGVPADMIHLELTEQSMIDYSLLQQQVVALEERGFHFVLDDYGSGYSNLTRVKHYPFVTIKIDMEVVWDYYRERDQLLPILVQGFKEMGLSVTAEGIETKDMADVLSGIGCDLLQGYYFCKPIPPEEFLRRYGS